MNVSLPVILGGLRLGHLGDQGIDLADTGLIRVKTDKAGQYQPQWNLTGGYVKYPYSISAFAPLSLLGDASTWLALSWTTELWL